MELFMRRLRLASRKTVFCLLAACSLLALALGVSIALAQPPTIWIKMDELVYVGEGQGVAKIKVWLSEASADTVTCQYATVDGTAVAPDDYVSKSGTVTFPPGETVQYIEITIVDDQTPESTEGFGIEFSNAQNAFFFPSPGTSIYIIDNDGTPPTVQFDSATATVSENAGTVTLTVKLSDMAPTDVTVDYATKDGTAKAGSDYTAKSGTLTFLVGDTSKTIIIAIIDDSTPEVNEWFNVELSNASGATLGSPDTAKVQIYDDDAPSPKAFIEIEQPGTEDDFVFLTPSDAEEKLTADASIKLVMPDSSDMNVTLSTESYGGVFLFSTDGVSWFSNISLTLPANADSVSFKLTGDTASTQMCDAVIRGDSGGVLVAQKEGTVPKVELLFKYKSSQHVKGEVDDTEEKGDNAAKNEYKKIRNDGTYNLGAGEFNFVGNRHHSWGTLTIGKVTPAAFTGKITLHRSGQVRVYAMNVPATNAKWVPGYPEKDFPASLETVPGNDNSGAQNKDEDPQSGGSNGYVYDIDAPGLLTAIVNPKLGDIRSWRSNFVSFATFFNNATQKDVRVSPFLKWYSKQSYAMTDVDKDLWTPDNTIKGDNETKDGGPFLLSYRLGSPTIKDMTPKAFSKANYATGSAKCFIDGTNLVNGCSVVFEKGGTKVNAKLELGDGGFENVITISFPVGTMEAGDWNVTLTNPADTNAAGPFKVTVSN